MKSGIIILLALLVSCGEKAPASRRSSVQAGNPALASAQLALAKNHIANGEPLKAIPYFRASLANRETPETRALLTETLASTPFALPLIELRHPFPILRFKEAGENLYVAIGGESPTLVRWDLSGDPTVASILFPSKARDITHLSL